MTQAKAVRVYDQMLDEMLDELAQRLADPVEVTDETVRDELGSVRRYIRAKATELRLDELTRARLERDLLLLVALRRGDQATNQAGRPPELEHLSEAPGSAT